ncbi:hypothetical protein INT43_004462 [Umbelopsis isabellina]|uniref:P-loop containing nucleoside triphosphate hydrolase protein n=1 Tax=Mortierella isabellina TaxID=91625 RepID=A0A8H7PG88_MORIS|nr:hypothetical protein INT43_004462 [Umbelopsis isabellina]
MSDIFWTSLSASITASGSMLTLGLQKALHWRRTEEIFGLNYAEDKSNRGYAFSDDERQKRLVPFTAIIAVAFVFRMFYEYQSYWTPSLNEGSVWQLVEVSSTALSWMYILLLAVLSQQYPLPNRLGWILNVHLCVFYFVNFLAALHAVWTLLLSEEHPVSSVMITFTRLLLNFDLLFITATVRRGPPAIDNSGRPVQMITTCSLWQHVTFLWTYSIIKFGQFGRQIEDADIASLPLRYRATNLFEKTKQSRAFRIIERTTIITLPSLLPQVITSFFAAILHYGPPYMMNRILVFLADQENADSSQDKQSMTVAYANIIGLFATTILYEMVFARTLYNATLGDVCTRGAYYMEIYAKTLKRRVSHGQSNNDNANDSETLEKSEPRTVGSVVNLMSVDTIRAALFYGVAHEVIQAPTELVVAIVLLYQILGTACLLGLSILVIVLPINHYNAKWLAITQRNLMKIRDRRVGLTNEIMQSIRQVKLFAWEEQWERRILAIRNDELKQIRNVALYQIYFDFIWQGCPLFVTLLSFWYYTKIQGQALTAATAFTSLLIYEELRYAFNNIPSWISNAAQYIVSLKRIESYLSDEELEPVQISEMQPIRGGRIAFENADIGWSAAEPENCALQLMSQNSSLSGADKQFTISDVTLEIPHNKMTIICGSTGAGKTLLILGLLGEAYLLKGRVYSPRSLIIEDANVPSNCIKISETNWIIENAIAYVAQTQAWLQNASIRDNILFGLQLNEERYKEVLFECALLRDLSQFEDGDLTEIGEKGITLSGGQKARVALARAVYSRAQHLLMDDVLSAVDAYTAKHIYYKCIMGPLMRNRTRLLVTHHVGLCLEGAIQVIIMDNGKIKAVGHPGEMRNDVLLSGILNQENQEFDNTPSQEKWVNHIAQTNDNNSSLSSITLKPKVLVPVEKRASGYVKSKLYVKYLKAMGGLTLWSLLVFAFISTRGMKIFESYWVKKWSDDSAKDSSGTAYGTEYRFRCDVDYYISVYAVIALVQLLLNASRFAIVQFACIRAARALYAEVLHSVLRAPLRFFDTTPVGRILNRFSKDFETIDSLIPNYTMQFSKAGINIISILLVVSFTIPGLLIPLSVAMIALWYLGKQFIQAGIQVRRLEAINRSLVFTHFTETIAGVTTLRAFGLTSSFLTKMADLADRNLRPTYCMWTINRWMSFVLMLISVITSTSIATYFVIKNDHSSASVAGLCLSYSLTFTDQALEFIRRCTSMQVSFNAVERIEEYTEIDQEAPAIMTPRPPSNVCIHFIRSANTTAHTSSLIQWPHAGSIEVRDLHARYADDLDLILQGISFNVKPCEKVGIVGRTGSGKSTIAMSIFRFIEAFQGAIIIDGVDIAKVGTSDLRSSMSIIPQDPVLFSGTLRTNLDPFDTYSDEEIYIVLKRVHLISDEMEEDTITSDSSNANVFLDLDSLVSEGGNNFSQGQRQLLCLARALLQRRRIVVMDEATASVDFKTDEAIQRTISSEFNESTILCIAHRLLTVIEYDRILVLDQGKVLEFDNPYTLIMNVNSTFHSMCKSSGEFDKLLSICRAKHQLIDV